MFDITVPIVTRKGFLISTFQAGSLEFPEKSFLSMPKWQPIDFIRHCISDLEKLLSGEHDRACVPAWFCDFEGATVPSCFWGINRIDSSTMGINQIFRYEAEHFESIHRNPEDWWQDVATIHEHWLGMTDCRSIAKWLEFYTKLVMCAEGRMEERISKSNCEHFSLTPFMSGDGDRCVCGLQIPSINCDLVIESKQSRITSEAYLDHWRGEMIKLLDGKGDVAVLSLGVDKENSVAKWIGMMRVDSGDIILSAPQERILEECSFSEKETVLFLHDAMKLDATVKGVANWASVSAEDMERWVYWAGTVLCGNEVVDDDPDVYPCQCGVSANGGAMGV